MAKSSATKSSTPTILTEAEAAVYGPRQAIYAHPRDNFERTARLWNGYLFAKDSNATILTASDVAYMMVLLKMARLMQTPDHRDSLVDMAGYAATAARVAGVDA